MNRLENYIHEHLLRASVSNDKKFMQNCLGNEFLVANRSHMSMSCT